MGYNITCDNCGKDVSKNNSRFTEHRLELTAKEIENISGVRSSVDIPPIDGIKTFCNLNCLWVWLAERVTK